MRFPCKWRGHLPRTHSLSSSVLAIGWSWSHSHSSDCPQAWCWSIPERSQVPGEGNYPPSWGKIAPSPNSSKWGSWSVVMSQPWRATAVGERLSGGTEEKWALGHQALCQALLKYHWHIEWADREMGFPSSSFTGVVPMEEEGKRSVQEWKHETLVKSGCSWWHGSGRCVLDRETQTVM